MMKSEPDANSMDKLLMIDSVMYRVSDLKNAERFYEEVLGLKRVWSDARVGMIGFAFERSDSEIVIHTDPDIPDGDCSYLVEDVVRFCDGYKGAGYHVVLEPKDVRTGKLAVVADPDGNHLTIIDLTKFGGQPMRDPAWIAKNS